MADLWHDWPTPDGSGTNGDLQLAENGDLKIADGDDETRQRFIRRLLTNPRDIAPDGTLLSPDYIFDVTYGVGARRTIGSAINVSRVDQIRQACHDCAAQEADSIALTPPPTVVTQSTPNGIATAISYTSRRTGRLITQPKVNL